MPDEAIVCLKWGTDSLKGRWGCGRTKRRHSGRGEAQKGKRDREGVEPNNREKSKIFN